MVQPGVRQLVPCFSGLLSLHCKAVIFCRKSGRTRYRQSVPRCYIIPPTRITRRSPVMVLQVYTEGGCLRDHTASDSVGRRTTNNATEPRNPPNCCNLLESHIWVNSTRRIGTGVIDAVLTFLPIDPTLCPAETIGGEQSSRWRRRCHDPKPVQTITTSPRGTGEQNEERTETVREA